MTKTDPGRMSGFSDDELFDILTRITARSVTEIEKHCRTARSQTRTPDSIPVSGHAFRFGTPLPRFSPTLGTVHPLARSLCRIIREDASKEEAAFDLNLPED